VPRLEQVLDLARSAARGIEFDIKSVRNYAALFDLVASYDLMSRSIFALDPERVQAAQSHDPDIRVIFNIDNDDLPAALFEATQRAAVFGSRRAKFTPEKIAAIHDGCSFVLPHSYDRGEREEVDELQRGLADGADGAQVNQPDVIAAAVQRRITAKLIPVPDQRKVCLRNARNELGIPHRNLNVRFPTDDLNLLDRTDRDGCIKLPAARGELVITHEDSPAVRGVELRARSR
jgi:hypothetical protein